MLLVFIFSFFVSVFGTDTPIIGILSQESTREGYQSYIAASYIKFVESAGGRAVPIWIGQNRAYYERVIQYTNGLLLPGGNAPFDKPNGYADAVRILYSLSKAENDKGIYYPILGICLGMEVLGFAELNGIDKRSSCSANDVALPLIYTSDAAYSRFFNLTPSSVTNLLGAENITCNNHHQCFSPSTAEKYLSKSYLLTSLSYDTLGSPFIATMEHRKYPFYATQYHPEKPLFEFLLKNIPHTVHTVEASQAVIDLFMAEAKKNDKGFPSKELEIDSLIYNFQTTYTGKEEGADFMQQYLFTQKDFGKHQLI